MISAPDLAAPRSQLADWLEICAVFASHGAGQATIASLHRKSGDEGHIAEPDAEGDRVDDEIVSLDLEELSDRIAEEIGSRATTLGEDYPFAVIRIPFHLQLKGPIEQLSQPSWVYLFLLLMSAAGDKLFVQPSKIDSLVRTGRTLFHVCASVGVAGLIRNAETEWFGFPRADGSNFLKALEKLCQRLGCGKAKTAVPPGLPVQAKDNEVDIIGWRAYKDRLNGNLVILCQAATGINWDKKSLVHHLGAFRDWFDVRPYAQATGAIAIPFPAYHYVCECPESGFRVAVHNAVDRHHQRLGVLIDRARIVEAAQIVGEDDANSGKIGGIDRLPDLKQWVTETVAAIQNVS